MLINTLLYLDMHSFPQPQSQWNAIKLAAAAVVADFRVSESGMSVKLACHAAGGIDQL